MTEQTQPANRIWKFIQSPLVRIVIAFIWLITITSVIRSVVEQLPSRGTILNAALSLAVVAPVAYLAYFAYVRIIEKRPLSEFATRGAVPELASGILVGAALFTITIGVLWGLGYYTITGENNWTAVEPVFISAVISGLFEEMLFRGIMFRIMEERLGSWLALLITALLFGLLHLANPNATLIAAVAIALEAGVLLAAAYMFTRRLWLPIGIHFAWNLTQGGVFGVSISGNQAGGLLQGTLKGPVILTGGEFGAEASIIAVIVCITTSFYLLWRAQKKSNLVKPIWKR